MRTQSLRVETLIELAGSVTKFARLLGVAHPTIYDWCKSGYIPGGRLVQISEALHIPLERLAPLVKPAVNGGSKPRSQRAA